MRSNFSEGRNMSVIGQITAEIERTEGVNCWMSIRARLTNRTVVTFVGTPEAVCEAAFRAVKRHRK